MNAILKKELYVSFTSPAAYVALLFFEIAVAVLFFVVQQFFVHNNSSLVNFFMLLPTVSVIFIPAITMGLWAEEIHSTTCDILYTLPISELGLVIGKFTASLVLFAIALCLSFPIVLCVSFFGTVDYMQVFVAYSGILLFGAASLALGQLLSVCVKNQIAAFVLTALVLIVCNTAHIFPILVQLPSWLIIICNNISLLWHFDSFSKGIIDSRDVFFFLTVTFAFLTATWYMLVRRKWK